MIQSPDSPPAVATEVPARYASREPLWWMLAMLASATIARVTMQWNVPLPACNFKRLTGLPCPLCGGTRALRSISEIHFGSAFHFNPLVATTALAILVWFGLWLFDRACSESVLPRLRSWLQRWPVWWIAGGLVLVNWFYLIRTLP